jgi:hypothetical protein
MLLVPTLALATPGDSLAHAKPLSAPSVTTTATLIANGSAAWYWYTVPLAAGQTVVTTMTANVGVAEPFYLVNPLGFTGPISMGSDYVSASVQRVTLMAPTAGLYAFTMFGDNVGDFKLEIATSTPVAFALSKVSVSTPVKKKKAFTLSETIRPEYDSFLTPVKFYIERWNGKKCKAYTSASVNSMGGTVTYSKFKATKAKLSKAGKYRVRAKFSDAAHPVQYTGYTKFTVK